MWIASDRRVRGRTRCAAATSEPPERLRKDGSATPAQAPSMDREAPRPAREVVKSAA